jgi:hypothetical protein
MEDELARYACGWDWAFRWISDLGWIVWSLKRCQGVGDIGPEMSLGLANFRPLQIQKGKFQLFVSIMINKIINYF